MLDTILMKAPAFVENFKSQFDLNFIQKDRWKYMVTGLGHTLEITLVAAVIGIVIGVLIAAVRSSYDKNEETLKLRGGFTYFIMRILNFICKLYLTVIRGTPVVVQLLITYFIIFAASSNGIAVAIFAFGINSGAYVAEIFRGGIQSIDRGQYEGAKVLGMTYVQTMRRIILPQVIRIILPPISNETITLVKDTSLVYVLAMNDLMRTARNLVQRDFSITPFIVAAVFYLLATLILTLVFERLEKRFSRYDQ